MAHQPSSPLRFALTEDDEDSEVIRLRLQVLSLAFLEESYTRPELYRQSVHVGQSVLNILGRKVRQIRSCNEKIRFLEQQLNQKAARVDELEMEVQQLQASIAVIHDDSQLEMSSMEAENADEGEQDNTGN